MKNSSGMDGVHIPKVCIACKLVSDAEAERDRAITHIGNLLAVLHGHGNGGQAKVVVANAEAHLAKSDGEGE